MCIKRQPLWQHATGIDWFSSVTWLLAVQIWLLLDKTRCDRNMHRPRKKSKDIGKQIVLWCSQTFSQRCPWPQISGAQPQWSLGSRSHLQQRAFFPPRCAFKNLFYFRILQKASLGPSEYPFSDLHLDAIFLWAEGTVLMTCFLLGSASVRPHVDRCVSACPGN